MRMSCNGCRVLRKGCSENCIIRPCLQWIKTPESQGNATVFLAKFYGRAGLMNLINAGPEHLRPDIFRSLLYEACGRIVNPIHGSSGLLWSGNWNLCQSAVESVLGGLPIVSIPATVTFKSSDIRHVGKESNGRIGHFPAKFHRVGKCRTQFKRKKIPAKSSPESSESAGSRPENESILSNVSQGEPNRPDEGEIGLELTLGIEPVKVYGSNSLDL